MKKSSLTVILVIVGVIVLGFIIGVKYRNNMVTQDQNVKKAWGNVENQYQRRLDLIPNLVNTVKGYAEHEKTTYENVTAARSGLKGAYDNAKAELNDEAANNLEQFQQSQTELNRQLGIYINAVHEAYPALRANENFMNLQEQLEGTENRIAVERTRYNEAVEQFNNTILRFPGSLFAWGYSEKSMFNAESGAEKAPKVDFGTGSNNSATDDF